MSLIFYLNNYILFKDFAYVTYLLYIFYSHDHHKFQVKFFIDHSSPSSSLLLFSSLQSSSGSSNTAIDTFLAINAELLAQHEGNNLIGKKTGGIKPLIKCSTKIMQEKTKQLTKLLFRDGCISISNIIQDNTLIQELKTYIDHNNQLNQQNIINNNDNILFNDYYGGVNCRGIMNGIFGVRQDMFLPVYDKNDENKIIFHALKQSFQSLLPLLEEIVTIDGMIHEVSCIIANPGR
jgi:hypothetical protein